MSEWKQYKSKPISTIAWQWKAGQSLPKEVNTPPNVFALDREQNVPFINSTRLDDGDYLEKNSVGRIRVVPKSQFEAKFEPVKATTKKSD